VCHGGLGCDTEHQTYEKSKHVLDILIKNAVVVDGTGKPAFEADVGVVEGRIVLAAVDVDQGARHTIDGKGLHLAPGFIDPHTHSDLTLLADPLAESKIRQGVTTEVIGNCGDSPAPLVGAAMEHTRAEAKGLGVDVKWTSMAEYLDHLRNAGTAVNVVPLVGHNTVRGAVLGFGDVQPTPEQQSQMERVVQETMEQGARGLSSGLYYAPGFYARTQELIGLARVVARRNGIYASHIRNESDRLLEAVAEALEIGEKADIQVEVAHLKVSGYQNWEATDRLVTALEDGRARGVRVGCDQYPYTASATWLSAILPYWAQTGGAAAIAARLTEPEVRARIGEDWEENRSGWDSRTGVRDWNDVIITDYALEPDLLGRSIADVADTEGKQPLEVVLDLIVTSEGQAAAVFFDQLEDNVRTLMRHPVVVIGSDGSALAPRGVLGQRKPHPRSYGSFPRVLGRYVREDKVLALEEAVTKMTSVTAKRFGLTHRGVVREGAWADLVLFDAQTVADRAIFTDPHQYPVGIPYVIVNGVVVIDQGQHTGALPGQVL
jgi:N-acyl-D-amino-acid deacylase